MVNLDAIRDLARKRIQQEKAMTKGDYLTKPQFGAPRDDVERAARDWLEANSGQYGEAVMRSLADLIKAEIQRNRKVSGPPMPEEPVGHTPIA